MTVNASELVSKLNFVITSRRFREKGYLEEFPPLPQNSAEEEDIISDLVFTFVKKLFVGCKVRANANSFSLRLDGHIHRKANKLRDIYNNEQEWRSWFENNHNGLFRTMRDNRQAFNNSSIVEKRTVDDKMFLYIPKTPNRIYGYVNHGLVEFCQWLENEYQRETRLAGIYDQVMTLMEAEIRRKEEERRQRIARELEQYKQQVFQQLFKPVAHLQESEKAIDRLFAHKFSQWARENGKPPEYAEEANAQSMVTRGLRVKIMAPPGSEEEGWVSLPPFEGYVEPEGYEMQGWGKVTNIDMTSERSRHGQSPIVVQEYLYTEFNLDHWRHLLPAEYTEIVEVTQRLRQEAEAEIEPWLEQERIQKAREEEERRIAEEARQRQLEEERRIREEEIRRQMEVRRREEEALARRRAEEQAQREAEDRARQERLQAEMERLIAQQGERQEEPEVDVDSEETPPAPANPDLTAALRAQFNSEPERATTTGLYRNMRAIPLERYVAIPATGNPRRFPSIERAAQFLALTGRVTIRDYHAPHDVVETYEMEEDLPF